MQKTFLHVWAGALLLLPLLADANFQLAVDARFSGQDGWDRARIDQVEASGKTTRVNLQRPLRTLITYGTASATWDKVYFKPDVHQRDAPVLTALNGGGRVHQRDLKTAKR